MDARYKPMLCATAEAVPDGAWVIEGKLDGWRAITHVEAGVVVYGGRNGKTYNGKVPYIEHELDTLMPNGTVLDGELIAGGGSGDMGAVSSAMTSGQAHQPSAWSPALRYVIFDVLFAKGADVRSMPWAQRRELLELLVLDRGAEHLLISPYAEASQAKHLQMLELGLEGSVVKRADSQYTNGRSHSWQKIKPQSTADAEVIGFKPGNGKFDGQVGALEIRMLDTGAETTAGGFDDATRADMTKNPSRWLGTVVEIEHHGIAKATGKPRHPVYFRRRDDIDPDAAPPPEPKPKPKRRSAGAGAKKMRAYNLMGPDKLLGALQELEGRYGDVRATDGRHMGTYEDHLRACREAARSKNLI
jgi:ATP-dependent DNA ligase